MLDLASQLSDLPEVMGIAPWPDHEYVKGWGVFGLPFDTGHLLALRVFPEGDFGSYKTVWHRPPGGGWSIHVDGPRLDTACPRYYGPACDHTGFAKIALTWMGPSTLKVAMDKPSLDWTLTASTSRLLDLVNAMSTSLPIATWKAGYLVRARELMGAALGMGHMQLSGTMPSGHVGTLMPERMYLVESSRAVLDGVDLGRPVHLSDNPSIGAVRLPARGVLAIGQGAWKIRDTAEYARTRSEMARQPEAKSH